MSIRAFLIQNTGITSYSDHVVGMDKRGKDLVKFPGEASAAPAYSFAFVGYVHRWLPRKAAPKTLWQRLHKWMNPDAYVARDTSELSNNFTLVVNACDFDNVVSKPLVAGCVKAALAAADDRIALAPAIKETPGLQNSLCTLIHSALSRYYAGYVSSELAPCIGKLDIPGLIGFEHFRVVHDSDPVLADCDVLEPVLALSYIHYTTYAGLLADIVTKQLARGLAELDHKHYVEIHETYAATKARIPRTFPESSDAVTACHRARQDLQDALDRQETPWFHSVHVLGHDWDVYWDSEHPLGSGIRTHWNAHRAYSKRRDELAQEYIQNYGKGMNA